VLNEKSCHEIQGLWCVLVLVVLLEGGELEVEQFLQGLSIR
jgi:hypothetical protein